MSGCGTPRKLIFELICFRFCRSGSSPARVLEPNSKTLWAAAFDYAESGLGSRERHVIGDYRLGEALEVKRAGLWVAIFPFSATLTR